MEEVAMKSSLLSVTSATLALKSFGGGSPLFLCLRLEDSDYQWADSFFFLLRRRETCLKYPYGSNGWRCLEKSGAGSFGQ